MRRGRIRPYWLGQLALAWITCGLAIAATLTPTPAHADPLSLGTGYSNYGGQYEGGGFVIHNGVVHLDGLIKRDDATQTVIAVLPPSARPKTRHVLIGGSHTGSVRVDVMPTGEIVWVSDHKPNAYVSLSGLNFPIDSGKDTAVPLASGASAYDKGYAPPRLRAAGELCVLSGLIRLPSTSVVHFATLPKECRPAVRRTFLRPNHESFAIIDIDPNGEVRVVSLGKVAWVSLSGVAFTTVSRTGPGHTVRGGTVALHGATAVSRSPLLTVPSTWAKKRRMYALPHGTGMARVDVEADGSVRYVASSKGAKGGAILDGITLVRPSEANYPGIATAQCIGGQTMCVWGEWTANGSLLETKGDGRLVVNGETWELGGSQISFDPKLPLFIGQTRFGMPPESWLASVLRSAEGFHADIRIGPGSRIGDTVKVAGETLPVDPKSFYVYGAVKVGASAETLDAQQFSFGSGGGELLLETKGPSFYIGGDLVGVLSLGFVPEASIGFFLGPRMTLKPEFRRRLDVSTELTTAREAQPLRPTFLTTMAGAITVPVLKIVSIDITGKLYGDLDFNDDGKVVRHQGESELDFAYLGEGTVGFGAGITGLIGVGFKALNAKILIKGATSEIFISGTTGTNPLQGLPFDGNFTSSSASKGIDAYFSKESFLIEFTLSNARIIGFDLGTVRFTVDGKMKADVAPIFKATGTLGMMGTNTTMAGVFTSKGKWWLKGTNDFSFFIPPDVTDFTLAQSEVTLDNENQVGKAKLAGKLNAPGYGEVATMTGHYTSNTDFRLEGKTTKATKLPTNATVTFSPAGVDVAASVAFAGRSFSMKGRYKGSAVTLTGKASIGSITVPCDIAYAVTCKLTGTVTVTRAYSGTVSAVLKGKVQGYDVLGNPVKESYTVSRSVSATGKVTATIDLPAPIPDIKLDVNVL
jgi:hypothetical protein